MKELYSIKGSEHEVFKVDFGLLQKQYSAHHKLIQNYCISQPAIKFEGKNWEKTSSKSKLDSKTKESYIFQNNMEKYISTIYIHGF